MLRGLLEKSLRESWILIAICCAALALAVGLFTPILPRFQEGLNGIIAQMPFFRTMLSGLVGIDLSEGVTPGMLLTVVWTHPIVLAIVWGFEIALCSRVPAGEIERGTIDVLLGWPVSRSAVYLGETIVWLAAGALLLGCGFLGSRVGALTLPVEQRPEATRVLLTLLNLYAVYVVVGGATQLVTALSERRGKAIGCVLAFVLASFLVNFLSQFWVPAERIAPLSFMHYYRPAQVLLRGALPWGDVALLLVAGTALSAIGWAVWCRRSIRTV